MKIIQDLDYNGQIEIMHCPLVERTAHIYKFWLYNLFHCII